MRDAVGRRWRLIVALALVGLLLGYLWGVADRPRYEATASVLVEPPPGGELDAAAFERLVALGASREVADTAAAVLGSDVAGADLLSEVDVAPSADGGTLIVTASSEQPDFAAAAADGYADALTEVAAARGNEVYKRASERLEEKLAELDPATPEADAAADRLADLEAARAADPLTLGAAAEIPEDPAENRPAALTALVGLLVGILVGLLAALIPLAMRRPPRPVVEVLPPEPAPEPEPELEPEPEPEPEFELEPEPEPEPALVSPAEALGLTALVSLDPEGAIDLEGERQVALRPAAADALERVLDLLGLDDDEGPHTVAVAGANDESGAAVAAGIGILAAERGMRAVVVDADLEDPALAGMLAVEADPGLGEYLVEEASPRDVLRTVRTRVEAGKRSLVVVPAGSGGDGDGVSGRRFEGLVDRLPRVYELVVFVAPPLPGEHGGTLPALADATIVVAGPDPLTADRADAIADALGDVPPVALVTIGPGAA